jgi:phosphatidylethanolamine/phosphatidyl-N-methylethanolamine N-methyltransferase
LKDSLFFLRAWISDPLRVAAILPSSRRLANLITSEITIDAAPVVELGAGTGVFTEELLARGVPESALTLVERDAAFVRMLMQRFPQAKVAHANAQGLKKSDLGGAAKPGAFVSGLPLLSMPPRKVISILRFAFEHMRLGGRFYQFTYMPYCPVPQAILDRLGLRAQRIGSTFANVPPATVYRLSSQPSLSLRKGKGTHRGRPLSSVTKFRKGGFR